MKLYEYIKQFLRLTAT